MLASLRSMPHPVPLLLCCTLLITAFPAGVRAQGGRGGAGAQDTGFVRTGVDLRNVLGGVPLTAADSVVQAVVARLDFGSYRELVRGLTQFGDRRQGTPRNAAAIDWIEQQLRSWGYETERVHYVFRDSAREQVFATKVGSTVPQEMYIIGAHMDGMGNGEAANDDGSGTALVMEIARVLASPGVRTTRSVRFALWNNEETGLNGARAYVEQRAGRQGIEEPAGSGRYPEPRWLGMIQHDMMMWDHGNPVTHAQALDADVDIEFQLNSEQAEASAALALQLLNANRKFASHYPAVMSNAMSNTDSTPFMNLVPAVSLRENRRLYETGNRANPHWHRPTDLFVTFSDADFQLGFNAAQTTLGAVARLVEARIVP
ncbi:MAG: M20/M25/M40 family metallo-hydrolase [Gemmatimonadota bacterium]